MIQFFFGPDKVPFRFNDEGTVEENSTMPFHGIISRGLLNRFIAKDIKPELWYQYAHLSFDDNFNSADQNLENLRFEIHECKVLSFAQSALCAVKYVAQICGDKYDNDQIELWNIKEGHTSSVWKVSINSEDKKEIFVVNVARDYDSGIELKETSAKLLAIGNVYPEINLAKVFELSSIKDDSLPFEVVVTKNNWIANSFEIHKRSNKETGSEELLLVERFLTDKKNPSKITSVVGRIFSKKEAEKITKDINEFLNKAMTCLLEIPELAINEGDVVWDGEKAIVIAIS